MTIIDRFRLDNRVAIVTGGNRGLGKEMARSLVEAGAQVAVVSTKSGEAQAAAQAYDGQAKGYGCDVTQPDQVETLINQVMTDFGQIDILVNNAGINIRKPIEELAYEEFQKVMDINVNGIWLTCRAVAPHMKAAQYGRVINIGSTLSIITMPDRTPYATSKGAVLQLSRTLALEWATTGITVNTVMPGPFATEMNLPLMNDPEKYKEFIAKIPVGRWGNLDEIGGVVVFLAGDTASFITGAAITVDGGWTAH
ncbi:MAG: glucose 1-dehydrogenase [Chloroflexota bacterium]